MAIKNRMVVITGVDGSGKSSVIKALKDNFSCHSKLILVSQKFRSKQLGEVKIENHALQKRSIDISIIKLLFKSIEWFLNYKVKYEPLLRQGYLIVFDRFYLDELMLDPKKHRYSGPTWLTKFACNSLPRPDVYILLDAPENVLFSRKKESSFQEVHNLRQAHLLWAQQQPLYHIIDASMPLESVTGEVVQIIKDWVQK